MIVLLCIITGVEMNIRYFWRTLCVCHSRISEDDNQQILKMLSCILGLAFLVFLMFLTVLIP